MGSGKGQAKRVNSTIVKSSDLARNWTQKVSSLNWKKFVDNNTSKKNTLISEFYGVKNLDYLNEKDLEKNKPAIIHVINELLKDLVDSKAIEFENPINIDDIKVDDVSRDHGWRDKIEIVFHHEPLSNVQSIMWIRLSKGDTMSDFIEGDRLEEVLWGFQQLCKSVNGGRY